MFNVLVRTGSLWMAGFEVTLHGRFWVPPEAFLTTAIAGLLIASSVLMTRSWGYDVSLSALRSSRLAACIAEWRQQLWPPCA